METAQPIDNQYTQPKEKLSHQKRNRSRKINPATFWVSLATILVILPLTFASTVIVYFQINQLNLPGVFVYDKPFGLINFQETSAQIDEEWNINRGINLTSETDPSISYWFSPAELGLWVDPQSTADAAYAAGRGAQPFRDILSSIQGEPYIVHPVLYFDQSIAKETLSKLEEELAIHAQEAQVLYQDGQWIAIAGSEGRVIDIENTIDHLYQNAFDILLTGKASLSISYPQPDVVDLSPVLENIDQVISQEMNLTAYDPIEDEFFHWSVPLETKRTWVGINSENYNVSLNINKTDAESLISAWEGELGEVRSFKDADLKGIIQGWKEGKLSQLIVAHEPTTYLVNPGESLWAISLKLGMPMYHIMNANEGLTMTNVASGMELDIPSKDILLPLPVVPNKRIVVDISEQRMTVYENGEVRNTYIISTGVSDSPTMPGVFQVQTHELNAYASNWDLYMPHFMGIYEAWPGFMNGIHGLPLLSGGGRLWASSLGSPASYGCIILDLAAAEDLYNWADPGVVVEIIR